jgi:diguanylate cyclase (GGDEF)-like protein
LPNRGLFENRLEHALARTYRRKDQIAVMFLDLDGFKRVNDSLGHGAGDELLTQVGQRVRECVRGSDTVARLGGDEFTILLEDVLDIMSVVRIADRIIKAVAQPFDLDEGSASVTTSIGVAFSHAERDRHESPQELLARADAALYEAKRRGKGGYVLAETLEHAKA